MNLLPPYQRITAGPQIPEPAVAYPIVRISVPVFLFAEFIQNVFSDQNQNVVLDAPSSVRPMK